MTFKHHILIVLSTAFFLSNGCHSIAKQSQPLTLIENGEARSVIVADLDHRSTLFAVRELVDIVKASTGVELDVADAWSPAAENAPQRILVGDNSLVWAALGAERLHALGKHESLVIGRGNNLILVGGDDWGTLYAVYDFVENEAGYRNFMPAPGGERFVKTDTLRFSGKETRRTMAFKGYRDGHPRYWPGMDAEAAAKFFFRNRMNLVQSLRSDFALESGLREEFHFKGHNHGFHFIGWEATFARHPEFFTQNQKGERVSNAQLCFSNSECRRYVTAKVLEIIAEQYPQGINCYVVASNDHHGSRYCWCDHCIELEKKYNSTGGPLWDYILELCAEVGEQYPDVFISTLAYKGPQQTEKAPDNIIFPDNFIADCAFLNSMRTLKEIPAVTLENGERFQKYENLLKWKRISKHVSYWFYGHATGPTAIYQRPKKELCELRDAGVESIFHCNFGGEQQFGEVARYVTLRLMIDPDQDARALAADAADFFYGAAAEMMLVHIDEMEELRLTPGLRPVAQNPFPAFTMLKPRQILRWREEFDKMEALTQNDPRGTFFVRVARTATDIWTMIFLRKIQKQFPDFKPDIQAIVDQGLATCDEMAERKLEPKDNKIRRAFESLQLFAHLKNDSIPAELRNYDRGRIIRHLPSKAGANTVLIADKYAVTGYAIRTPVAEKNSYESGVGFELYDALERQWLFRGQDHLVPKSDLVPNRYALYRVGTDRIPKSSRFVTGNLWGTGLDIDALSGYYNPDVHNCQYEIWISMKFEGPKFDPESQAEDSIISWDQIFLVDQGVAE